ncbi:MAG: hypothetical protein JXM71_05150, partial [Spirochaetales bacterium]|nr:hypothetical protein [Spirochaetales bacterium]
YPEDATFIEGVEFELRIPKAFKGSEASVAWSVYSSVTPAPSAELLDYEAELIATQTLPARVSMNLVLPMIERHGIQGGPFASLIPSVASADRFPLVFKLSPVGKGFNPSMEAAEFKLTVRPILGNEGGISISVHFPEGEEHGAPSIFVDDKLIQDESSVILAKKGARVLRISAEGYREEVVTIAVEPGRVVPVSVALTPNAPFIVFQAPDGTVVTLDGKPLAKEDLDGLAVEPGEHTLAFKIGDYSMTRKLMALRGKTYQVILSVELEIDTAP